MKTELGTSALDFAPAWENYTTSKLLYFLEVDMYEAKFFVGGSVVNRERMSVSIEILVLFLKMQHI